MRRNVRLVCSTVLQSVSDSDSAVPATGARNRYSDSTVRHVLVGILVVSIRCQWVLERLVFRGRER